MVHTVGMAPSPGVDRRQFLVAAGVGALLAVIPPGRWAAALEQSRTQPGTAGRFLTAAELDTLRAITGRLLPGPPEDPDPGAIEAHAAEAIDLLLGAFTFDPPLIYAGGPWSDRAGGAADLMAHFIAPDPLQELGWRIRLEGSQGRPEREFAGPVEGLQTTYRTGLASIEKLAGTSGFIRLSPTEQDRLLRSDRMSDFAGQVLGDSINAMYGPPEYGGNAGLVGWRATQWPGDVQPRGYSDTEVSFYDAAPQRLPYTMEEIRQVAATVLPGLQIVD